MTGQQRLCSAGSPVRRSDRRTRYLSLVGVMCTTLAVETQGVELFRDRVANAFQVLLQPRRHRNGFVAGRFTQVDANDGAA